MENTQDTKPTQSSAEPTDIWGNIQIPEWMDRCPSCGVDRGEIFGMGHQASCDYGSGRDLAGAKERRRNWMGRAAYEEDVRRCPNYMFGTDPETGKQADGTKPRPGWDKIEEVARESWRERPEPTDYYG